MKRESILFGIIGLVIGVLVMMTINANAVSSQNEDIMRMIGINQGEGMGMESSMRQMTGSMDDKYGYDFDKAFIDAMIVHHEAAVEMARQAEHRAQHQEIKDLSKNIINAQAAEIEQMEQWKKDWMME